MRRCLGPTEPGRWSRSCFVRTMTVPISGRAHGIPQAFGRRRPFDDSACVQWCNQDRRVVVDRSAEHLGGREIHTLAALDAAISAAKCIGCKTSTTSAAARGAEYELLADHRAATSPATA